jgi:L-histidine N-alpha-methyltransferase
MSDAMSIALPRDSAHEGVANAVAAEVWTGLGRAQKELSPKFFYDARGAALFDEITRLPEYYLTRTEHALLSQWAPGGMARIAPRSLVELGPGAAEKTRLLLDALPRSGAVYVPVDVSLAYLEEIARKTARSYPALRVLPTAADITTHVPVPDALPRPVLFAFLGSTIGNFDARAASALLRRIAVAMQPGDAFLLGADLKKDRAILELAYNDPRGVTAEFNRNILRVVNREAGTDFDIDAYDHLAYYATLEERIEMHLVARTAQRVDVPGHGSVNIGAGESIRTEISCKYDRTGIEELFLAAGLALESWTTDGESRYALAVGRAAG